MCLSACQCLGKQRSGVDAACGSMKLMVTEEVRPLQSREISTLTEKAKRELSPPACYPGHHSQNLPFSGVVPLSSSAVLSPWSGILMETISPSYWDLLCQTKSPGIVGSTCRGAGTEHLTSRDHALHTVDWWKQQFAYCSCWGEARESRPKGREHGCQPQVLQPACKADRTRTGASGNTCGDPSEKTVLYHFRPVDLSLWKWYSRAEIPFAYTRHPEYVAFLSFEAFLPSSCGRVLNRYPGRRHAQETCYSSLPSPLRRNQAQHLYSALYK